jgi:hypothetical protein
MQRQERSSPRSLAIPRTHSRLLTHILAASAHQPVNRRYAVGGFAKADEHVRVGKFHECRDFEFMPEQR